MPSRDGGDSISKEISWFIIICCNKLSKIYAFPVISEIYMIFSYNTVDKLGMHVSIPAVDTNKTETKTNSHHQLVTDKMYILKRDIKNRKLVALKTCLGKSY